MTPSQLQSQQIFSAGFSTHRRLPLLSALASYLDLASARSVMLQQAGKIHHHFSLYHLNHLDCTNWHLTGIAKRSTDKMIPWVVEADTHLMVHVDSAANKKIVCLAEMACKTCQSQGITELSMIDHDISGKLEALKPWNWCSAHVFCIFLLSTISCTWYVLATSCMYAGRQWQPCGISLHSCSQIPSECSGTKSFGWGCEPNTHAIQHVGKCYVWKFEASFGLGFAPSFVGGWSVFFFCAESMMLFCNGLQLWWSIFTGERESQSLQGEDQSIPSSHHTSEAKDVVSLLCQDSSPDCCAAWVKMFVSMLSMLVAAYFV